VYGLILTFCFLKIYTFKDDDEELKQCIREIKRRLGNMGTILADSNEAMRCEYVSANLHASLYIVITFAPQLEFTGRNVPNQASISHQSGI
jgi:hypothetical protein